MQFLTTGKNLDIGDALRRRIEQRLTGNPAKYLDGTVGAHVVVELQTVLMLQSHDGDGAVHFGRS